MMRLYMTTREPDTVVMVREAEYNFTRYVHWAENLDREMFIVIDGAVNTDWIDKRRQA